MKATRVAKRYARALIELAEKGQVESWGSELERLAAIVDSPELEARLASPELSNTARQEAMAKIAERLNLSFPLRSLAVVIARHRRIDAVSAIAVAYRELVDEMLGRERATLTFAVEPSDEEKARVLAGLEAIAKKKIIPTIKVDKELLGGVVAELGGRTYDGSLAGRLSEAQLKLAGEA
jgi:F-type H+-transporting ATPase subunit delta